MLSTSVVEMSSSSSEGAKMVKAFTKLDPLSVVVLVILHVYEDLSEMLKSHFSLVDIAET
jgi:hypothetical protein